MSVQLTLGEADFAALCEKVAARLTPQFESQVQSYMVSHQQITEPITTQAKVEKKENMPPKNDMMDAWIEQEMQAEKVQAKGTPDFLLSRI